MQYEELKKKLDKSDKQTYDRFELEEALMSMYKITEDLELPLEKGDRSIVVKMHLLRTDHLLDVFEYLVKNGKIT